MPTNEEIIKKNETFCKLWHGSLHTQYHKDLSILMNEAKADTLKLAISHMRVARSNMCLKDRAILLNEINLLEIELKKLEE